jgi:hypothetical protein
MARGEPTATLTRHMARDAHAELVEQDPAERPHRRAGGRLTRAGALEDIAQSRRSY